MKDVGKIFTLPTATSHGCVLPKKIDWNFVRFDCMPFSMNQNCALLGQCKARPFSFHRVCFWFLVFCFSSAQTHILMREANACLFV